MNGLVQTALMTRSLVLLNQALIGSLVDFRNGFSIALGSSFRITVCDGLDDIFNCRAQALLERYVVVTAHFGLGGALRR